MPQEGLHEVRGDEVEVMALRGDGLDVRKLDAVDPFHGHAVAPGQLPVDLGHAEARIFRYVLAELGEGGGLQPQIHLDARRLGERVDNGDGPQAARGRDVAFLQAGRSVESVEIGAEPAAHAGADHLDRDLRFHRGEARRDGPAQRKRRRPAR